MFGHVFVRMRCLPDGLSSDNAVDFMHAFATPSRELRLASEMPLLYLLQMPWLYLLEMPSLYLLANKDVHSLVSVA